ncbi:MAG: PIN domain nuclease [Pseudomonadota bacterium]
MIVVDSSVWIDYFNGNKTVEADYLDQILGYEPILVGDLILLEVLQGFRSEADFRAAKSLMEDLPTRQLLNPTRAIVAANNFRSLKKRGATVRKAADVIIGSYCIAEGLPLLFSDRDFAPMVKHLGLQSAMNDA